MKCRGGVCSLNKEIQQSKDQVGTIIKAAPILTPYYRDMGTDTPGHLQLLAGSNYTTYDLFTLSTKFKSYAQEDIDISFTAVELNGKMRITLNILKGGEYIPINKEAQTKYQNLVDFCLDKYPNYCIVYDNQYPLYIKDKIIPHSWIKDVMGYLNFDIQPIIEEGRIFVDLSNEIDYNEIFNKLNESIINQLEKYYEDGYYLLPSNSELIEKWNLIPNPEIQEEKINLYKPDWKDYRFAPDPVFFLNQRIQGNFYIEIRLPFSFDIEKVRDIKIINGALIINSDNYKDAVNVTNKIATLF